MSVGSLSSALVLIVPRVHVYVQEVLIKPGWVKLKHNVAGSSLAWHPVAHHLSYPMAVVAGAYPTDPIGGRGALRLYFSTLASTVVGLLTCRCMTRTPSVWW